MSEPQQATPVLGGFVALAVIAAIVVSLFSHDGSALGDDASCGDWSRASASDQTEYVNSVEPVSPDIAARAASAIATTCRLAGDDEPVGGPSAVRDAISVARSW